MKANYVFFVVFSLLILFGWNTLVVKRLPPPAAPPARASAPAEASTGIPPAPSEERPVEKVIGRHRIVFNAADGGVLQWRIEDGPGVSLVLPDPDGEHPLAAFPGLVFQDASTDEEPAFEADRPDGLAVRQSYRVAPDGFLHAVTIALENTGDSPVNASFELGWGAGIVGFRHLELVPVLIAIAVAAVLTSRLSALAVRVEAGPGLIRHLMDHDAGSHDIERRADHARPGRLEPEPVPVLADDG